MPSGIRSSPRSCGPARSWPPAEIDRPPGIGDAIGRRNPTPSSIVSAIDHGAMNAGGPGLLRLQFSADDHDGYPGV